eukprot:TRINITY_DN14066_c0_g1_i1.p1 TRINITY_DN14066_c0_g1~~TRINITY_DN14066_c0_g1_i1.p1  ORF type:complete len:429 (+),score=65.69 TRINITY_DN14066_c0_g1_i1:94-1380(+)
MAVAFTASLPYAVISHARDETSADREMFRPTTARAEFFRAPSLSISKSTSSFSVHLRRPASGSFEQKMASVSSAPTTSASTFAEKPRRHDVVVTATTWRTTTADTTALPMRSFETKNSTPLSSIQSLRLVTAIKTPYLPDGRFDLVAFDALVHQQIECGVEGIIVGGTTGEGQLMSWDEHIMLIAHAVNCFGDKIKVVGNTGSNSTREAIHATEQGFAVGMHAALHINPYYGKTSMEGLLAHFRSVLPMGPTIVYNVPGRTGQDIPPTVIRALHEDKSGNLAGVKECTGNARIGAYSEEGIITWTGNDDECHDARWLHGAQGVMSVMSNLVPGLSRQLMFEGRNDQLKARLAPLASWLFCEPNPIGLNTAMAQLGLCRPVFRLPYVPLPVEKRRQFVQIVADMGIQHFAGARDVQVLQDDAFVVVGRH